MVPGRIDTREEGRVLPNQRQKLLPEPAPQLVAVRLFLRLGRHADGVLLRLAQGNKLLDAQQQLFTQAVKCDLVALQAHVIVEQLICRHLLLTCRFIHAACLLVSTCG